jgi:glycosyltransferase involved in cell wall biosynthesis
VGEGQDGGIPPANAGRARVLMNRLPENCEYRCRVREQSGLEVADCLLLETITGVNRAGLCTVRKSVCESCCATFPPTSDELNPVLASFVYKVASVVVELGGVPGCDVTEATILRNRAEARLTSHLAPQAGTVSCDVVLCCNESGTDVDRAIESVLNQKGVHIFLHLVDDGGGAAEVVGRYSGLHHVFTYTNAIRQGALRTLHELVPRLRSSYVAVQYPGTLSTPERLRSAVSMLEAYGAEILAAPVNTPSGLVFPERPRIQYRRYLPLHSLVFRRASLVDMGGIADRPIDADAELIYRAFREKRGIVLAEEPAVESLLPLDPGLLGAPPRYEVRSGALRHHAIGFAQESVACDVVLPFCGHLEFLRESLPSVLDQVGAETIVHLIDDATPGGADELLRYWGSHPRVRTYRNSRNLGQFVSFNNVFPYLETNLIAIQDADDISLPQRVRLAGNHLRLADADFFGGRFETFEHREDGQTVDESDRRPDDSTVERRPYWASEYPRRYERIHFLQNTTAVMRRGAFESLRGFSDYGEIERNKCGLDTEFFVRAHHSGCRFALSQDVVVRYRWHRKSATRNQETGWGTEPRTWVAAENERRFKLFHRGPFDARAFGSLHQASGLTHRIT